MPRNPRPPLRPALTLAVGAALSALVPGPSPAADISAPAPASSQPPARLCVLERSVAQDRGHWQVDYRLRYEGPAGLVVRPSDLFARVEGDVSNSRVPGHAAPLASSLVVSGGSGPTATAELLAAEEEARRCREHAVLLVWQGGHDDAPAPPGSTRVPPKDPAVRPASAEADTAPRPLLSLDPGGEFRARLRLEHQHAVFGDYDPLLGTRRVEIRAGEAALFDTLELLAEHRRARAEGDWPAPPSDRCDTRIFLSAPDSLHLEAHIPGNGYYRFPERPVRYGTRMRLRFWYLIAPGTEGECRARLAQYRDSSTASWKPLPDGCHEEHLPVVGRWVKVERVFRTESEATTLALDFRILGSEQVGELWVDDVTLEPVHETAVGP